MTYIFGWLVEGSVVYTHFAGALDLQTLRQSNDEKNRFFDALEQRVYNIVDVRDVTRFPMSLSQLGQASTVVAHPNVRLTCTMVPNSVLKMVVSSVSSSVLGNVKVFSSDADVLEFLRAKDSNLIPEDMVEFPKDFIKIKCS